MLSQTVYSWELNKPKLVDKSHRDGRKYYSSKPTSLSIQLQKGMFVPSLKELGQNCQTLENR